MRSHTLRADRRVSFVVRPAPIASTPRLEDLFLAGLVDREDMTNLDFAMLALEPNRQHYGEQMKRLLPLSPNPSAIALLLLVDPNLLGHVPAADSGGIRVAVGLGNGSSRIFAARAPGL